MKKEIVLDIIVVVLLTMFLYASFSKYFDFAEFQRAMHNQPFPQWINSIFIVVIPPIEIITAYWLMRDKSRLKGLWGSLILMGLFTLYIAAILLGLFPKIPCSCGGIIRMLSWQQHLIFNLFFLLLSIVGIILYPNKYSSNQSSKNKQAFGHKDISRAKSG